MKIRLLYFFLISLFLFSCSSEDDICVGGEATPRMKIKFKTLSNGKFKTLDSVFVKVDYGNGAIPVLANNFRTDSITIPLRVDDTPFTKIYVGLSRAAVNSEIKINYKTNSEYVSPACGIKKNYQNVSSVLETPNAVVAVEQNQNEIINESKTHLFLLF